jgi:hypothetical protein
VKVPLQCKIVSPDDPVLNTSYFYAFGFVTPSCDIDHIRAWVMLESGLRIEGVPQETFYPYNWCFQFVGLPPDHFGKLVVAARDARGCTCRDITPVIFRPDFFDLRIWIDFPSSNGAIITNGNPFSTWGRSSPTTLATQAQITYDADPTQTSSGPGPGGGPRGEDWQFNFTINAPHSKQAVLTVYGPSGPTSPPLASRTLQFPSSGGG